METPSREIHITAKRRWLDLDFKELWRYRDLIVLFVKRNFKLMYKQTILGPLWLILNPLLTSVVFSFVFGGLAGMSSDGLPQFLFYMSSNTMWGLFHSSANNNSSIFVYNENLFSKVYFPRITVPISQAITSLLNFAIQFVLLLVFYVYYLIVGVVQLPGISMLWVPLLILQAVLLGSSVGLIVASLTVKYRDLGLAYSFGMQLWMYITPIVYPLSSTGGLMKRLILLNPMTPIVNNFRYALLRSGEWVDGYWYLSIVTTGLLLLWACAQFNHTQKTFADTI